MITKLLGIYKKKLGAVEIYELMSACSRQLVFKEFLCGINGKDVNLKTDLPVWVGNPKVGAQHRIMVVGEAPHDRRPQVNMARIQNTHFGAIFAAMHWRKKGPFEDKICQVYPKAFADLLKMAGQKKIFVLFTDLYKTVDAHKEDKPTGNEELWKTFMLKEIKIVQPHVVIALGKKVCCKLNDWHVENVMYVRHPAQGGVVIAKKQICQILRSIFASNKSKRAK